MCCKMETETNTMGETRSIDTAKEASTNLVALNNTIVNMRACVKAAKVQVIHKLTRVIQKLKTKKGTEEQKEQNLRKAQRRLDEVFAIKELNIDRVSKFALQNTTSFDEASKQPTATLEFRSLARLAEHKLLATKVKNFREEHSDWQDLAAFLYAKQTGRRFKTKKQKLRAAKKGSKFLLGAKTTAEEGDPKGAGKDEATEEQSHRLSADDSNEDDDEGEKENRSSSADDSDENVGPGESADESDDNEGSDQKEEVNIRQNHREKENTISDNNDHENVEDSSDEDSDNEERGDEGSEREHNIDRKSDVHKRTGDMDQGEQGPAEQDIQEESDEEGDEHLEADTDEDEDSDEQERSNTSADEDSFEEEDGGDDMNKDTSEEESEEEESAFMKTSARKHLKENNKSEESDRTAVLFQKPREPNVVKDPFFMCDDDEDDDAKDETSGHWIPESALERANSELLRGGKFRRRGGEREPRSERPFTAEDDRWLVGEFNDDFANGFRGRRGGGFSRGRGDSRRGKEGSFRDRGNSSYRGRGDRGRGSSWRGQGRDSDSFRGRGRDSDSFRGRGRDSGSFRGRGKDSDSSRGRGRDSDSFRGRGREFGDFRGRGIDSDSFRGRGRDSDSFRGRGRDSDSFRGRGLSRGGRGDGRRDQGHSGIKKTDQCDFSHPSWEAKRKRKEMEKTASFSGKKIKFDD